ncbi:MAG TPA: SurA N-terminal domain-containing protein [Caulobacteraceae bacterium]
MIALIRRLAKSWFATILLSILIVSFAVFGIGDVFRGMNKNAVLTAGSRTVTTQDFRREFDGYKQQMEQKSGEPMSAEQAVQRGLDRRVLEGLAGRESFAELMHRMGVRVSDRQVADQIKKIPAFFDRISGKFDQQLYAGALAERQLTPALFERFMRDDMAQQQVTAALASGLRAPRAYAALGAAFALESRDATWFQVTPGMVPEPPKPTDAQLRDFMKENAAQLTRPEFRQLSVVQFSTANFKGDVKIDPAEVEKRYNFAKDSFATPETRTIVQVPAKDAAAAAKVAQALQAGGDIAAAARSIGAEPVLYQDKPKTAIVDRRVADAAFALPEGQVSQPIQGELGFAVVKVMKVTPGKQVSFAEAKPQIEAQLRQDAIAAKVYEQTQVFEDAQAAGATLPEAAAKAGVKVANVPPITAQGQLPSGVSTGIPEQILKTAFDLPSGGDSEIEELDKGEYYALHVDKVIPATLPPLEEVKPQLTRVWMMRELVKSMEEKAKALAERVRKGEPIDKVAASVGAKVNTTTGVSRANAAEFKDLGRDFLIKLIGAKPVEVITAQSAQLGFIVAHVDAVRPAAPHEVAKYVEPQREQLTGDLFRQLGNSAEAYAREKVKARTNLDLARQAIGVDPKTVADTAKPAEKAK